MKPLKGYKNITDLIIPQACSWEGCNREGNYCSAIVGEKITDKHWYCRDHVVIAAWKEKKDGDKN